MTARHTFHTPSFGDEEFELPTSQVVDPPYDGQAQVGQWQSFSVHGTHSTGMYGDSGVTSGDDSDENGTKNVKYSTQDAVSANMGEKKKKRDPNEPKKPVSAYALFFRDTQAAIKVQNPNASFGEVSKVVASMWDALDPEHKNVYKKKTEAAKKEYLKSLAAYRANALSRGEDINNHNSPPNNDVASPKPGTVKSTPTVVKITRVENNENLLASATIDSQNDFQNNSLNTQPSRQPTIEQQHQNMTSGPAGNQTPGNVEQTMSTQKCIRDGCSNIAIVNPDWEDEYCSNECVIVHCRNVFTSWVQANMQAEAYPAS